MKTLRHPLLCFCLIVCFVLLVEFITTGVVSDFYEQHFSPYPGKSAIEVTSTEDVLKEVCDKPGDCYVFHYYRSSKGFAVAQGKCIQILNRHYNGKVKFLSVDLDKVQPPKLLQPYGIDGRGGLAVCRAFRIGNSNLMYGGAITTCKYPASYSELRQDIDQMLRQHAASNNVKESLMVGQRHVVGWNY